MPGRGGGGVPVRVQAPAGAVPAGRSRRAATLTHARPAALDGPRPARSHEYRDLIRAATGVFFPPGSTRDMAEMFPLHLGRDNLRNLWVIADRGRIVSHVGVTYREVSLGGVRVPVSMLGAVFTVPTHRGRGLSSRLLAAVTRVGHRRGCLLHLISGYQGIYRRIGAAPVGRRERYDLPAAALRPFRAGSVTVTTGSARDVAAAIALHHAEPNHFVREPADYRRLVRDGWGPVSPGRLRIVRQRGRVVAAWVEIAYGDWEGSGRPGRLEILEFAGSRPALFAAWARALTGGRWRRLLLKVDGPDRSTRDVLATLRVRPALEPAYDSTAVLDVRGLLERFRPRFADRLGEPLARRLRFAGRAGGGVIRLGAERLVLAGQRSPQVLFGKPVGGFLPLRAGPLRSALAAVLPLPLINPGLNYV